MAHAIDEQELGINSSRLVNTRDDDDQDETESADQFLHALLTNEDLSLVVPSRLGSGVVKPFWG